MIHLEFTCVYVLKYILKFLFFFAYEYIMIPAPFIEKAGLSWLSWLAFVLLSKVNCTHICGSISGLFILSYWSICLSLYTYYTRKKWSRHKTTSIRCERVDSTDTKFDHFDEMDIFLERHKLAVLTQKEIVNPNSSTSNKEICDLKTSRKLQAIVLAIVLSILDLLHFCRNFWVSLSISTKTY